MLFSFFAKSTMYWTCSFVRIKWQLQLPPYKGAIHFKGIHETLSRPGLSISLIPWNRLSRRTAKPTKWPAKWRLRSTWHPPCLMRVGCPHEETLGPWLPTECCTQADLRLRRAHVSFCLFCLAPAELLCFPKSKSSLPTFPVPQNCLCASVPLIFIP